MPSCSARGDTSMMAGATHDFSNLTVIVPSYNARYAFVLRTAQPWSSTRARLLIMDESKEAMPAHLQRLLPEGASYHHVPSFYFHERLQRAADLAETEFVIISPDDSFHIHSAIARCLSKLEADPEIFACNGIYCYFSRFRKSVICLREISDFGVCDSRNENVQARLVSSCHTVFLYGVVRTSAIRVGLSMLATKYAASSVGFHVFQFGLAFTGKWDSVRELMWFRSYEG